MIPLKIKNHPVKAKLACICLLLLGVILAACSAGVTPQQTATPSSTPLSTLKPAATATSRPTNTPDPTSTPTPALTVTAIPTRTRVPTRTDAPTRTPSESEQMLACPGAPDILLKRGDWAMVSTDPPLANRVRSQPGSSAELLGQIGPGENVLVVDGPSCADGYTWWLVRTLDGLEGWTVEGDAEGYWLQDPIYAWYPLPNPLASRGTQTYDLREISISADTALVSGFTGEHFPLATPLPRPQTVETPEPDDPRYSEFGTVSYTAHSYYRMTGVIDDYLYIFDLQDNLSRFYLNHMSYDDCTRVLRDNLDNAKIVEAYLDPFCGTNGGIPLHFIAAVKPIQFDGGKGVRYLISSANYQTVNKLEYMFQGLSDDGRYFIRAHIRPIVHPYIVDTPLVEDDFGPLIAWKEGQYEQAQKSYDRFNARIEQMLNAGVVPLYPSLELLDSMMASIEIKR